MQSPHDYQTGPNSVQAELDGGVLKLLFEKSVPWRAVELEEGQASDDDRPLGSVERHRATPSTHPAWSWCVRQIDPRRIGSEEAHTPEPSVARSSRRAVFEHPLDASRAITRDLESPLYRPSGIACYTSTWGYTSPTRSPRASDKLAATSSAADPECVIVDESMAAIFATTIVV